MHFWVYCCAVAQARGWARIRRASGLQASRSGNMRLNVWRRSSQLIMSTSARPAVDQLCAFACVVDEQAATGPFGGIRSVTLASPLGQRPLTGSSSAAATHRCSALDWVNHLSNASCGTQVFITCATSSAHSFTSPWHHSAPWPAGQFCVAVARCGFYAQQQAQAIDSYSRQPCSALTPLVTSNTFRRSRPTVQHD